MCDVSAHAHWPPSVPLAPPGRRGQPQNGRFYLLEDARWNISIDGTVASVRDLLSRGTMGVGQEEHLVDAFLLDGLQRHPRRTLVRGRPTPSAEAPGALPVVGQCAARAELPRLHAYPPWPLCPIAQKRCHQ